VTGVPFAAPRDLATIVRGANPTNVDFDALGGTGLNGTGTFRFSILAGNMIQR
jgi:hypothetical protein